MSLKSRPAWWPHAVKPEAIGVYLASRSDDDTSSRAVTACSYAFTMAPRWSVRAAFESRKAARRSLHPQISRCTAAKRARAATWVVVEA